MQLNWSQIYDVLIFVLHFFSHLWVLLIQYFYTKIKVSFADIKGIVGYFQCIEY